MENYPISLFKGYSDTHPTDSTLQAVVGMLRDDRAVAEHTEKHRYYLQHGQSAAAAREKSSCPCFAVAVRFSGGTSAPGRDSAPWTSITCPPTGWSIASS